VCDLRHLTTLFASVASYGDSVTFYGLDIAQTFRLLLLSDDDCITIFCGLDIAQTFRLLLKEDDYIKM
jgi:hypothetical protein